MPGKIGVIAFKVQAIAPKDQQDAKAVESPRVSESPIREPEEAKPLEVHKPETANADPVASPDAESWPDLWRYPVVSLREIRIPKRFRSTVPNVKRTKILREEVRERGQLDQAIVRTVILCKMGIDATWWRNNWDGNRCR